MTRQIPNGWKTGTRKKSYARGLLQHCRITVFCITVVKRELCKHWWGDNSINQITSKLFYKESRFVESFRCNSTSCLSKSWWASSAPPPARYRSTASASSSSSPSPSLRWRCSGCFSRWAQRWSWPSSCWWWTGSCSWCCWSAPSSSSTRSGGSGPSSRGSWKEKIG